MPNYKHLYLVLALGLLVLPLGGIIVAIMGPESTPSGPGMSTTTRILVAGAGVVVGGVIAGYAALTFPTQLILGDNLTIQYFTRKRVFAREQVTGAEVEDRTLKIKSPGDIPMTAKDTLLTIRLTDDEELSLSLPTAEANRFHAALQLWRQGTSSLGRS